MLLKVVLPKATIVYFFPSAESLGLIKDINVTLPFLLTIATSAKLFSLSSDLKFMNWVWLPEFERHKGRSHFGHFDALSTATYIFLRVKVILQRKKHSN